MYEVYAKCPVTGEPFYAGVREETLRGTSVPSLLKNSICPVCGSKHEWRASSVVLEIPLTFPEDALAIAAPAIQQAQVAELADAPVEDWPLERAVGAE